MWLALLLIISVLCGMHAAVFPLTLTSIQYPAPGTGNGAVAADAGISRIPLRGPVGRRGDVWGPAVPGSNILPCGSVGNKDTYDRIEVEKGTPFNVMGRIWSTMDGEGTLTLSIKYGSKPDFRQSPGMLLLEYTPELTQTPLDWVVTAEIPEPAFSDNATIQVEYLTGSRPENWTEPFLLTNEVINRPWSTVYQCIDLTVIGAAPRPAGAGENYDPNDYVTPTPSGTRKLPTITYAEGSSGLSPLYIGLIIAAVVIALCLILLLVCCLCRKKKIPPETLEEANTENIKAKPVPPPTSPPEGPHVRLHFEEAEQPTLVPEPRTDEIEEAAPKDGSFGRLFHFKYVEGDEEHGEEDLRKQQRTLERPRTLQREFDQATVE